MSFFVKIQRHSVIHDPDSISLLLLDFVAHNLSFLGHSLLCLGLSYKQAQLANLFVLSRREFEAMLAAHVDQVQVFIERFLGNSDLLSSIG